MGAIVVVFMAIVAIFMGIYYIGSEYQIGAGFCAIALGIIILIALGAGKFDEYIEERPQDTAEYVRTEAIHDTITSVHVYEVPDTVYLPTELDLPEEESAEDSVEVEIVSEIPLTEDEVDSLAGIVICDHCRNLNNHLVEPAVDKTPGFFSIIEHESLR